MKVVDNTIAEEQWKLDKKGKFSASNISKLMTKGKDNTMFSAAGLTYIKQTACDAYTLFEDRNVQTYDMLMGKVNEPDAFALYAKLIGFAGLEYFGDGNPKFFLYNEDSGSSPDCLAPIPGGGISFGGEFKCPKKDTHWDYLNEIADQHDLKAKIPEYFGQVQFLMRTFKCELWHWISYNNYFPLKDRALIIEVKWDKKYQDELEVRLASAIKLKYELIDQLKNRK